MIQSNTASHRESYSSRGKCVSKSSRGVRQVVIRVAALIGSMFIGAASGEWAPVWAPPDQPTLYADLDSFKKQDKRIVVVSTLLDFPRLFLPAPHDNLGTEPMLSMKNLMEVDCGDVPKVRILSSSTHSGRMGGGKTLFKTTSKPTEGDWIRMERDTAWSALWIVTCRRYRP